LAYTQYTLASLGQEISVSLQDPDNIYWSTAEIYAAIKEGLLYWGALTSYWRERGAFTALSGVPIYDLNTQFPSLRARTYTLGDFTTEIQYHFLEPPNGISGSGMTDQFTAAQFTTALKRKRNEFVLDSRVPLLFTSSGGLSIAVNSGIVTLPDYIALISRAAWTDLSTTVTTPINLESAYSAEASNPLWTITPGLPVALSVGETQPLQIQFIPPPLASGNLNLLYVSTIDMNLADSTSLFSVPDEFAHSIKYAAMYELLSTSNQAYDPTRAEYCLQRYRSYIEASKLQRSIVRAYLGNLPLALDTFQSLDSCRPYWQNRMGTPSIAACAYDILALADVPSTSLAMSADVIRSAPLPATTADYVQLGREEIPYLMDYCRHVLSFKMGGSDFLSTMVLYDNFLAAAKQRNKLLSSKIPYLQPLFGTPKTQEAVEPAA
jgi:hypothetical protein